MKCNMATQRSEWKALSEAGCVDATGPQYMNRKMEMQDEMHMIIYEK